MTEFMISLKEMSGNAVNNALYQAVPSYDPYAMVEVSKENWKAVRIYIPEDDTESIELYEEADSWAEEVFKELTCFTILGLWEGKTEAT